MEDEVSEDVGGAAVEGKEDVKNESLAIGAKPDSKLSKSNEAVQQVAEDKAKETARKFKLKVFGEEKEVDEEQALRYANKGIAADKIFRENAELKKGLESFLSSLKDPKAIFKLAERMGLNPAKIAADFVYENEVLPSQLTPEQRELREVKAKMALIEADKKEQDNFISQEQERREEAKWTNSFQQEIIAALESDPDLPRNAETVARLAFHMKQFLKNREEGDDTPLRAASFLSKVKEEYGMITKNILTKLEGKSLLGTLGEELRAKIRKAELESIGIQSNGSAQEDKKKEPARRNGRNEKIDMEEFNARVARRIGN